MTFSPDGEWVAFHEGPAVFVARADGSSPSPATIANATTLLAWTRDDRLLYTRDREGTAEVFAVAMVDGHAAGEPARLEALGDMGRLMPITLAPGRGAPALGVTTSGTLIHGRVRLATDAVTIAIDPTTGAVGPERVQRQVAAFGFAGLAGGTRYSPDGTRVLYTPTADSVLIQEPDGRTRSLIPQLQNLGRIEWAPEGDALIIAGRRNADERGVYRVDLRTGAASLLVADERPASYGISHDGGTLFYSKTDAPSFTIAARNLRTGVERAVYMNDDPAGQLWGQLRVSRDGRRLALVTLQRLELVDLTTGRLLRRFDRAGGPRFRGGDWEPEGRYLFVTANYEDAQPRSELWRIPVDGGEPERHRLAAPVRGGWMRADGREFSMIRWDERWQVWSMEHFLP